MHAATPQVRAGILAAAGRVIARDGSEALTIAGVAAEAGLSVGGLRYHFASKRELLVGLVEHSFEGFDQALATAGSAPGDRTRAYIAATLSDVDNEGEMDLAAGLMAAIAVDSSLLAMVQEFFGRWQSALEDDGIDPAVAITVRLAMDGWWMAAFLGLAAPQGRDARGAREVLDALVSKAVAGA
jgi:AcrR family transcriptional regulator